MPKTATIVISGSLDWSNLPKLLRQLEPLANEQAGSVILDLSDVAWCCPIGVATLAASVYWLAKRGFKLRGLRPTRSDIERYLERIDFYRVLKAPDQFVFNRYDSSGRFVELIHLTRIEDCMDVVRRVNEVLWSQLNLSDRTMNALDTVVGELTENIFHHAQSAAGGFLCCQSYATDIQLAFVDLGRGIERALAENPEMVLAMQQNGVLQTALQAGTTGRPTHNAGYGLFLTSELIKDNRGLLGIQSYDRRLFQHGHVKIEKVVSNWPGTAIHLKFLRNRPLDILEVYKRLPKLADEMPF
ncbi:MAG: STAS domain-containing protein [Verrucomicrobia bacterium]|nr:STAS domain-containing protein [Verrucomicrobiota bacterium]